MNAKNIGLGILGMIFIVFIASYNSLNNGRETAKQNLSDIQSQLQRRYDLIPNLVETVKGYASHEKDVLIKVTEARSKATSIQITPEMLNNPEAVKQFQIAQAEMKSTLSRLIAVAESYPNLKTSENFKTLQAQLEGTENRVNTARLRYNNSTKEYNVSCRGLFSGIVAKMFGFQEMPYYEADVEALGKAPKVNFKE